MTIARDAKSTKKVAAIRMNERGVGEDVGRWVVKKTGGKARVAMLTGPAGASFARAMANGFKRVIAGHPGIKIVTELHSSLAREAGLKLAEDVLTANKHLDVIYCANDDIALGVAQAVQAAKRTNILSPAWVGSPRRSRRCARGACRSPSP